MVIVKRNIGKQIKEDLDQNTKDSKYENDFESVACKMTAINMSASICYNYELNRIEYSDIYLHKSKDVPGRMTVVTDVLELVGFFCRKSKNNIA